MRLPTSRLALSIHLSWCNQWEASKMQVWPVFPQLETIQKTSPLRVALRIKSILMVLKSSDLDLAYVPIKCPLPSTWNTCI